MEYLAIFAIAALMTLPLIILFVTQSVNIQADIINTQTQKIASIISGSTEELFFMGEPAQKTIKVQFPSGIKNVVLQNQQIIFEVQTADLEYNVTKDFAFNVTGEIRTFEGPHNLILKAQETILKETFINITDK